jgi:DnaK suppressor protein
MSRLKQEELGHLRVLLEARRKELRAELRELLRQSGDQQYRELAGMAADAGDDPDADLLADIGAAIADRHAHELRDIEAARARLTAGDYGACVDCGGEIAYERLVAFPTVARCITCQERAEKPLAHGGAPTL